MDNHQALPFNFPLAEDWSILLGSIGKWGVLLSLLFYVCTMIGSWICFLKSDKAEDKKSCFRFPILAFILGSLSLICSFICLEYLFIHDQFQYDYIFKHSEKGLDLWYRISALWAGQQGSFLLWAISSAVAGLISIPAVKNYRFPYFIIYSFFMASLSGILAYETPFELNIIDGKIYVPPTGAGLQPSLLNYWITIHPPTIFLGFGMLTVLYAAGFSALTLRNYSDWIVWIRPWTIMTMTILGLGLCMGGFWAYETLGWGGFWAWDPVENSSFVPWCFLVAFLHGQFIQNKTGSWNIRNGLLAMLPLVSFLFGTFLTRSGVLSEASMHSFATMDKIALKVLIALFLLSLIGVIFAAIVSWRHKSEKEIVNHEDGKGGLTKKQGYVAGIVLISLIGLACAIGMSVPLIKAILGESIAIVEPGVYEKVLFWLLVPLLVCIAVTPYLSWQRTSWKTVISKCWNPLMFTIFVLGIFVIIAKKPDKILFWDTREFFYSLGNIGFQVDFEEFIPIVGEYGFYLSSMLFFVFSCLIFALCTNSVWFFHKFKNLLPTFGGFLTHLGLLLLVMGLVGSKGFETKGKAYVQKGKPGAALGYTFHYTGMSDGIFERGNMVLFEVTGNKQHFQARPELYYVHEINKEPSPFAWPYIYRKPAYDVYFTVGPGVFEATDATSFKQGEDKVFEQMMIVYKKMEKKGEAGMIGTSFIAEVEIKKPGFSKTYYPRIEIGEKGLVYYPVQVDDNLLLYLMSMNAADYTANLQLYYKNEPIYPLEVYIKPLTLFVWLGTFLMTLGGLWSSLYRLYLSRKNRKLSPI